jgi:hypothetical protein
MGLQGFTVQGMKKRKRNIFEGICKESSTERFPLFQKLWPKPFNEVSPAKEDIIALKEELIRMNKTSKASTKDITDCLEKVRRSDCQTLDAILPHLLEGHDLSKNDAKTPYNGWLGFAIPNIYLIKSLLYFYNVPLSHCNASGREYSSPYYLTRYCISNSGFVLNKKYYKGQTDEDCITFVQAIFTPPDRFIQEAKECSLPIIQTFLLCVNHLKNEKRLSSSHLPKRLINQHIRPLIIDDAIPGKLKDQCQQIKADVREQIKKATIRISYYEGPDCDGSDGAYNFLANDFEAWAQNNMDLAILAYPLLFGVTQSSFHNTRAIIATDNRF